MPNNNDFNTPSQKRLLINQSPTLKHSNAHGLGTLGVCIACCLIAILILIPPIGESPSANAAGGEMQGKAMPNTNSLVTTSRTGFNFLIPEIPKPERIAFKLDPLALKNLESVNLYTSSTGHPVLVNLPNFNSSIGGKIASRSEGNELIVYSLNPNLQKYTNEILTKTKGAHVAVVAMEPSSGRILAISERSPSIKNLALHSGFPAASLFKVVTAAAATEQGAIEPDSIIKYSGGLYNLNQWNYKPNAKRDRYSMSVSEAMGKSCNLVFSRIALKYLDTGSLREYANHFGFNTDLEFDAKTRPSLALFPTGDYELGRTAAGFGQIGISPVHAAAMISSVANEGALPRPWLIDRVVSPDGQILYETEPQTLRRSVSPKTAKQLLKMMEYTTTMGTARRSFYYRNRRVLPGLDVAAKTGTLTGDNPQGLNNWFVAAAPMNNPEIAVAVIVVSNGGAASRASEVGRQILQKYFSLK